MNIILNSEEEYNDYIQNYKFALDGNELDCILIYVDHLYSIHKKFPIKIDSKRESPDSEIQIGEITIGLEHTRASCQALTYAEEKLKEYPEGSMLEIPDCENIIASKESVKTVIRKPGEKLKSAGWGDYGPEKLLIKAILNSIKDKTGKLKNYEIYPSNELIVYDNILNIGMRWDYVMSELKKQHIKINGRNFDKIHLIVERNQLKYDIMSKCD